MADTTCEQPLVELKAGMLTMWLEPETAFLRYVCFGEHEVVRGIYGAVRDRNWGTVPSRISDLKIEQAKDSFRVTGRVDCISGEIDYRWSLEIVGQSDGTVTYLFDGEARSAFLKNRIGLCVLHPMDECAGQPCQVVHSDGSVEESSFPAAIASDTPFKDVAALRYSVGAGQQVEIRFEGEVFETEDQRNWTDASFKTFSTPLTEPFPVQLQRGARMKHTVRIKLLEPRRQIQRVARNQTPRLMVASAPTLTRPPVGVVLSEEAISPRQAVRLRALQLAHLRVNLHQDESRWGKQLASQLAREMGATLHIALTLPADVSRKLDLLAAEVKRLHPPVSLWIVYHEDEAAMDAVWLEAVRRRLEKISPNVPWATGTKTDFAELNRIRPRPGGTAFLCYAMNPQIHAFDNRSLVETLAAQPVTVESARQFFPRPVVISWISLRPQSNAVATGPPLVQPGQLPSEVDSRQMSLFGAAWTLGSLARLSSTGQVHSLTYYETIGWRGLMEREMGSPAPEKFPSSPGAVFPLYHVLADLAGYEQVCPTRSTHPLRLEGMILVNAHGQRRVLVANLVSERQEVVIETGQAAGEVRVLDQSVLLQATDNPEAFRSGPDSRVEAEDGKLKLELEPYATARVDLVSTTPA